MPYPADKEKIHSLGITDLNICLNMDFQVRKTRFPVQVNHLIDTSLNELI